MGVLDKLIPQKKDKDTDFVVDPNSLVKKKQMTILIGVVATLLFVAFYLNKSPSPNEGGGAADVSDNLSRDAVRRDFEATSKVRVDDRDIWMSSGVRRIEELSKRQQELEAEIRQREEVARKEIETKLDQSSQTVVESLNQEIVELRSMIEEMKTQNANPLPSGPKVGPGRNQVTPGSGLGSGVIEGAIRQPIVVQNRFFSQEDLARGQEVQGSLPFSVSGEVVAPRGGISEILPEPKRPTSSQIRSVSFLDEKQVEQAKTVEQPRSNLRKVDSYIPAGTFFPAVLLGGVDAPTGGQAQNNPHPVFLMVDNLAFLPNRYKYDIKECRVIGHSYGDLASERAIMRLETLSCIDNDGNVFEKRVKGHIFGEDGKAGVRGRVVEKTGQLLMRSLIAGVASGIGTAFQQQAMTYSTSPLGTTSVVDPDQVVAAGVGTGIGRSLDRLSQYYIDLAENLFPVIEIGSQRVVDIVLTEGIDWLEEDDRENRNIEQATDSAVGVVNQAMRAAGINQVQGR
ncbi:MAG: hypothetical protein IBX55_01825 [Methyloprofundus sp.]|nr:hypothetical protein [Methyloprofundus sp.]